MWAPGSVSFHERGVRFLYHHESGDILASTETGRLRFSVKEDGVHYEADLPGTTLGNDLLTLVRLGEIRGVSPGFWLSRDGMKVDARENDDLITILKAEVFEVSLTSIPAYQSTTASIRNQEEEYERLKRQITERKLYLAKQQRNSILFQLKHKGQ